MKLLAVGPVHWALLDQGIVSVCNFLVGVLLARSLSGSDLASYSLAYTSVLALSTVHRTLVSQPMNVLGAQESVSAKWSRYRSLLVMQRWMLPLFALIAVCVGLFYFPLPSLLLAASAYLVALCLQDLTRRFFYTDRQIEHVIVGDGVAYVGQVLAVLAVAWSGWSVVSAMFIAMCLPLLLGAGLIHRRASHVARASESLPASQSSVLSEHWESGKWLVLSQLVWIGASQLVPFQLAAYAGADDVVGYHVANSLMNALNVLRITLGNYLPSHAASIYAKGGRSGLGTYLARVALICLGLSVAALLFFVLAGSWVIDFVFGAQFVSAKLIVPAMAVIHLLAMSSLITSAGAQVLSSTKVVFVSNIVALLVNALLGKWLISSHGLWGGVIVLAIGLLLPALIQAVHLVWILKARAPSSVHPHGVDSIG